MDPRQTAVVVTVVGALMAALGTCLYLFVQSRPYGVGILDATPVEIRLVLGVVFLVVSIFLDFRFFVSADSRAKKVANFPITVLYALVLLIMWLK